MVVLWRTGSLLCLWRWCVAILSCSCGLLRDWDIGGPKSSKSRKSSPVRRIDPFSTFVDIIRRHHHMHLAHPPKPTYTVPSNKPQSWPNHQLTPTTTILKPPPISPTLHNPNNPCPPNTISNRCSSWKKHWHWNCPFSPN